MSYKVLVVDDSKLARMVMASALRRIRPEWILIETANADEALATVDTVDIALIDFNMPGTDGLELVATHTQRPSGDARRGRLRQRPERDYQSRQGAECRIYPQTFDG